ncbi:PhnE/PtxC family ABC transporter permease [Gracilibacillus salinarum]|uniref:ABC transporter permease subunit n=1 Tax=Gracilibacillus salinarum TaxID=2932255 RepID=A0ABY4GKQ3_9BACI|nr:ABC transporter permease subunit [Gracilibacillus salinarum]UOQ84750.1 ABC transporter permease subunit [Gracilibacillus salinarum]
MERIRVTSKGSAVKSILTAFILVTVFIGSIKLVNLDVQKFFERLENVPAVIGRMMVIDLSVIPNALLACLTSLSLAFLTLVVSVIIAMLLSFLAARNITPSNYLANFIKAFFAVIRSVPGLVWGLMVIASLGFGYTSGFIAMLLSSIGYLIKLFTGSIEEVGTDIVEAMRSTGASWFNIVFHGLIPLCITSFFGWITVRFEGDVAESIGLGIIGVGGIGLLLTKAIGAYDYAQTTTILIVICLLMLVLEFSMTKLKTMVKYGESR